MSLENVEIVRALVDAVNERDPDAFVACLSADVEWEDSVFWTEGARTYRGRVELREWFNQVVREPWESLQCEVAEITEAADDRVLMGGVLTARGKDSGAETQLRFWSVSRHADGKIARRQVFRTRAEALEAAGLRE
jgi:ketosteroid isomerase-like protein